MSGTTASAMLKAWKVLEVTTVLYTLRDIVERLHAALVF